MWAPLSPQAWLTPELSSAGLSGTPPKLQGSEGPQPGLGYPEPPRSLELYVPEVGETGSGGKSWHLGI